jgi:CheY-like chemotaxis protein
MTNEPSKSVLVVEDDHIDAEYILKTLEKFDISVEVAVRSYEAISYLQRKDTQKPSFVLLDWKISGGGESVLRVVREDPVLQTTPVVILSRSTAHVDVRAAYAGHANAFVAKAGELHDFQRQVTAICDFFLNTAQLPPGPETE